MAQTITRDEGSSSRREDILAALRHPAIRQVNPGIDGGLNGSALVDNIIGVIESARDYAGRGDTILKAGYEALRVEYPGHFPDNDVSVRRCREAKPAAYKAINGF